MSLSFRTIAAAAVVALASCHTASTQLGSETASVRVSPAAVDFGNVYVGANPQQIVSVVNSGGAPDTVTVGAIADGVFTAASGSFTLEGGASEGVAVTFLPTQPGAAQATLHIGWSGGSVDVTLSGTGAAWPACTAQGLCGVAVFDPNSGVCAQSTQPDGTPCADSAGCLTGASCQSGQCLGTVATCDDDNPCNKAVCVIGQGCQSTPVACPATSDPCQASSCDPVRGCVVNQVPDGTPCSSTETCQSATVCLAGSCTGTPVPDGTSCSLSWAPCVTDASCKHGTCDSPTADAFQPGDLQWSTAALGSQGGLAIDAQGGLYFVASGTSSAGGHVVGLDQCGNARWTSSVPADTDVMLDGDQLVTFDSSVPQLAGVDVATGALLWQLPLPAALYSICSPNDFSAGSGGQYGASLSPPVMSAQGQIFVAGNCQTQSAGNAAFLLAAYRDGTVDWLIPAPYADAEPVVDASGNVYLVSNLEGGGKSLSSFDATGASRFTPVTYGGQSDAQLVLGGNQVVDIANGSAFGLGGGSGFDLDVDQGPFANAFYSSIQAPGGVVDAAGNVYFPYAGQSALEWGGVSPSGSLLWSLAFASDDNVASYPVLSAEGTLLALESESQDNSEWQTTSPGSLVAIDTGSGALLWSKSVSGASSLALGPSGMLLLAGGTVQGVYAGPVHLGSAAPWSRYRGDNTNRGAAVGP